MDLCKEPQWWMRIRMFSLKISSAYLWSCGEVHYWACPTYHSHIPRISHQSLSLNSGYHQTNKIYIQDSLPTRYGLHEYLAMSFGSINAPTFFISLMNSLFMTELDMCVAIFIHDILVYSKDKEEHANHLRIILDRLHKHQLYARISKCHFWLKEASFLGQVLSDKEWKTKKPYALSKAKTDSYDSRIG